MSHFHLSNAETLEAAKLKVAQQGKTPGKQKVRRALPGDSAEEDAEKAAAAHARAKRRWGCIQRLGLLIVLLHRVRKKNEASNAIQLFMEKVGEWVRMKAAITKFLRLVLKVQRQFRDFSRNKRMRLMVIEKQWTAYEDEFLSDYFALYFRKLFDFQQVTNAAPAGAEYHHTAAEDKKMEILHSSHFMDDICHWHKFRVPRQDRHEVLEQYYRLQLKK